MVMEKRTSMRHTTPSRCRPVGESSVGPGVAPTVSRRKWAAPRAVLAIALAQPGHQHVSGAGGDGQQLVAPLAGIAGGGRPPWPVRSRRWCRGRW